jgi:hypothetical protein
MEGRLETLLDEPFPHTFHGGDSDADQLGDFRVVLAGPQRALVSQQQDARMVELSGRRFAGREHFVQLAAFFLIQRNPIPFGRHGDSPFWEHSVWETFPLELTTPYPSIKN